MTLLGGTDGCRAGNRGRAGLRVALLTTLASCGVASVAHAEPSREQRAAAEVLFNEAGKLYREGRFEEACSKLASSERLDPAVGTLLNLGRCYEKIGRTASAWFAYVDATAAAKAANQGEREKTAREAANRLAPALPKLLIRVPDAVQVPGLQIQRDGEAVPTELWNVASPSDPGEHRIEARAPGKKPWSTRVTSQASQQTSLTIPALADEPRPPEAAKTPSQGTDGGPPATVGDQSPWSTQRIVALAVGGAGIVSVGVGLGFGVAARSSKQEADKGCGETTCYEPAAHDANERAQKQSTLSTVFVGAGAALAVGGVVLWLTAPKATASSTGVSRSRSEARRLQWVPLLTTNSGGLLLNGVW